MRKKVNVKVDKGVTKVSCILQHSADQDDRLNGELSSSPAKVPKVTYDIIITRGFEIISYPMSRPSVGRVEVLP